MGMGIYVEIKCIYSNWKILENSAVFVIKKEQESHTVRLCTSLYLVNDVLYAVVPRDVLIRNFVRQGFMIKKEQARNHIYSTEYLDC